MEVVGEIEKKLLQESQEIHELQASIARTHTLCDKSTAIIEGFDLRLVRLETTILPIHGSTQQLSKVYDNMERTLEELEKVMGYFDSAQTEEKFILGNVPSNAEELQPYFECMDRLRASFAYIVNMKVKNSDSLKNEQKSLLNKGSTRLEALFKRWLAEASSKCNHESLQRLANEAKNISSQTSSDTFVLPSEFIEPEAVPRLCNLANYLASYESDMVIHGQNSPNTSFCKAIIEARTLFFSQVLSVFTSSTTQDKKNEVASSGFYQKGSSSFLPYTRLLLHVFQLEGVFLQRLVPSILTGGFSTSRSSKKNIIKSIYESIVTPSLTHYTATAEAIVVKARRNVTQNHDFSTLFLIFDILGLFILELDDESPLEAFKLAGKRSNDVRNIVNEFITTAFRSLLEFLEDLKNANTKSSNLPDDGTVHEISSNSLGFLKRLAEFPEISEILLRVLQNLPNWEDFNNATGNVVTTTPTVMSPTGETDDLFNKISVAKSSWKAAQSKSAADSQFLALKKYCTESISALISKLETKAKAYKKTLSMTGATAAGSSKEVLAAIFLLNNYHFILKSLRSNDGLLLKIVGGAVENMCEEKMKGEMNIYQDSWRPILAGLVDMKGLKTTMTPAGKTTTTLSKPEKKAIKEKFKNFNSDFEETYKTQKKYSIPDIDLRAQVVRDVKQVLGPVYAKFLERFGNVAFTKKPEKYVKYDVESLDVMMTRFFDPSAS